MWVSGNNEYSWKCEIISLKFAFFFPSLFEKKRKKGLKEGIMAAKKEFKLKNFCRLVFQRYRFAIYWRATVAPFSHTNTLKASTNLEECVFRTSTVATETKKNETFRGKFLITTKESFKTTMENLFSFVCHGDGNLGFYFFVFTHVPTRSTI